MRLADLRGRRVAVWGTGREGIAAVRAIAGAAPAELFVIQDRETFLAKPWTPELAALAPLHSGEAGRTALSRADVLVRSPIIGQTHPWVVEFRARGGVVTGGTALWLADHADRTVGITGSKGKSTTASLTSHLLTAFDRPNVLGGNIGTAVLDLPDAELYVLELSVYQCADITDSPRVAALTSLFPEHLDWSGSEQNYYRDKVNLAMHGPRTVVFDGASEQLGTQLGGHDLPLAPVGGPDSFHLAPGDGGDWIYLADRPLIPRAAFPLAGRHNAGNLCVALGVLAALGIDCLAEAERLGAAVAAFKPLAHRLTPVPDPSGLLFVDDSLSTIPQSAIHAIEAYQGRPLTVILGGEDRGVDYLPLRNYLADNRVSMLAIGIPDSGPRIIDTLAGLPTVTTRLAGDLFDAVSQARRYTAAGGVVLLSPAAPSYGRFDNFEHRSRVFLEAIEATRPTAGQSAR